MGIGITTKPTYIKMAERKSTTENKQRVLQLLREDSYTITELARIVGIDRTIYYDWLRDDEAFAQAVKEAKEEFRKNIAVEAHNSLRRLVQGYTAEEVTIINVPSKTKLDPSGNPMPVIKEQRIVKKHIAPNTAAIIFALTNLDPDKWKNRQEVFNTGKMEHEFSAKDIPDDMLREITMKMQEAESQREKERRGL